MFQRKELLEDIKGLKKAGETPTLTDKTLLSAMLKNHMAPKGKCAKVVVLKGKIDFVWEDDLDNVFTIDADHPFVIETERYHHLIPNGESEVIVEFYRVEEVKNKINKDALRPGEAFIK